MGQISYNPGEYSGKDLKDDKFYKDLGSSFGIPSFAVQIKPRVANIDFSVESGNDAYFDIGNAAVGPIAFANIGAYLGHSFYTGSLFLKIYCSVSAVAGGAAVSWLATGLNTDLSHYLVDQRAEAAVSTSIGVTNTYNFDSVTFNYLRLSVTGGTQTYKIEALFNGIQIVY